MQQTAENILNGPDYFYCERFRIRMKKTLCVERQIGPRPGYEINYNIIECKNCKQGKAIAAEIPESTIRKIKMKRVARKRKPW